MSRKPADGSLEAAALSMAQEVSGNPDDWERRRTALYSMQQAVDEAGKTLSSSATTGGEKAIFTAEVWRHLREPLKNTLNDLRSAIVKEACVLLEKLSTAAGNSMAPFMRDMLNVLLQLMANGNSVIVGQVDSCMRHIIDHSRFPRQLKEVEYAVRSSRSNQLRESVGSYVLLMLRKWPAASMEKEAGSLESIIALLLRDASSAARTDARASFGIFMKHWPKRADKILQGAEPRTVKSLSEMCGIGEAGIAAGTSGGGLGEGGTATKSAAAITTGSRGGGGASRVLKAAGGGGGVSVASKGLRKGPPASDALRAAESAGDGPALSPHQHHRAKTTVTPGTARRVAKKITTTTTTATASSGHTPPPAKSSATRRGTALVAGIAIPASPAGAMTASPSPVSKAANFKKRRPASPAATASPVAAAPTSLSKSPVLSASWSGSTAKAKRAPVAAAVRPLALHGSNSSNSTTPTESSSSRAALSRPGTAVSSPLLVSPDGFLAAPGRVGGAHGAGGGGSQEGASFAGFAGLSEGATSITSLGVGDKVCLQGDKTRTAVVRYVGETQFATGVWVGVELSPDADPQGNNNGSVNGVSYFDCPPACGVFAKPDMFELLEGDDEEEGEGEGVAEGDAEAEAEGGDANAASREVEGGDDDEGQAAAAAAAGGSDEASRAGRELLRCHALFANEALEALKDEMAMIPGLEGLVESNQSIPADRVRLYLEALEIAAEARQAAADRLRRQIRETAKQYPNVFSPSEDADADSLGPLKGGSGSSSGRGIGAGLDGVCVDLDDGDGGGEGEGGRDEEDGADGCEDGEGGGNNSRTSGNEGGVGSEGGVGNKGGEATAANGEAGREDVRDAETSGAEEAEGDAGEGTTAVAVEEAGLGGGNGGNGMDNGIGNVFGMAGKFLMGVLNIPPGGDEAEQAQQAEEAGGRDGAADSASPIAAATTVDTTSPSTPNAVATDSQWASNGSGKGDGGAAVEESGGVGVSSVVIELT